MDSEKYEAMWWSRANPVIAESGKWHYHWFPMFGVIGFLLMAAGYIGSFVFAVLGQIGPHLLLLGVGIISHTLYTVAIQTYLAITHTLLQREWERFDSITGEND